MAGEAYLPFGLLLIIFIILLVTGALNV